MPKEISNNDLGANTVYLVRGKVAYSHISRQTTDEERARANARRKYPIDKNYAFLTLYGATVVCKDPQAPTPGTRTAMGKGCPMQECPRTRSLPTPTGK